jgi:hypothetical protein
MRRFLSQLGIEEQKMAMQAMVWLSMAEGEVRRFGV